MLPRFTKALQPSDSGQRTLANEPNIALSVAAFLRCHCWSSRRRLRLDDFSSYANIPVAAWIQTTGTGLGFGLVFWLGLLVADLEWRKGAGLESLAGREINDLLERARQLRQLPKHDLDPPVSIAALDESFQCLQDLAEHWRGDVDPGRLTDLRQVRQRMCSLKSRLDATSDSEVQAEYAGAIAAMLAQEEGLLQCQKEWDYARARMHRCVAAMERNVRAEVAALGRLSQGLDSVEELGLLSE